MYDSILYSGCMSGKSLAQQKLPFTIKGTILYRPQRWRCPLAPATNMP